jgi:hypothetical protein
VGNDPHISLSTRCQVTTNVMPISFFGHCWSKFINCGLLSQSNEIVLIFIKSVCHFEVDISISLCTMNGFLLWNLFLQSHAVIISLNTVFALYRFEIGMIFIQELKLLFMSQLLMLQIGSPWTRGKKVLLTLMHLWMTGKQDGFDIDSISIK